MLTHILELHTATINTCTNTCDERNKFTQILTFYAR